MEFARKQLEKYGWTDGKGLGKDENGISEPLKAKIKRSQTGVGYNPASDFTEHWWSALYDKAASNLEVENKNGKTKKIRRKSNEEFEITNSTWKMKRKKKEKLSEKEEYSEFFVKTAVMGQGGDKTTRVRASDSQSESEIESKDAVKMTDEELFTACQGRTAHKGARHGLRALGKLARIEQQEQILLQQIKYKGYSHHEKIKKNSDTDSKVEDTNLHDKEAITSKKKRKKKKRCNSTELQSTKAENIGIDSVAINENEVSIGRKSAKSKTKVIELNTRVGDSENEEIAKSKRKKRKRNNKAVDYVCNDELGLISMEEG
ncbi:G patch domain-containing protein 4 [Maniola hyperantus]|uniref:G patch domain-containing protein 4 n=1 Tax=Aphantopus hyperantus TaxID=2795564 RepID=UPI0015687746|nr:G patch domain-containing protein 4 [Maniola hyperantus]